MVLISGFLIDFKSWAFSGGVLDKDKASVGTDYPMRSFLRFKHP